MTSYYRSLEISYDYEAYQLYAEQEMEAAEALEIDPIEDYILLAIPCYNSDNTCYIEREVNFDDLIDEDIEHYKSLGYHPAENL